MKGRSGETLPASNMRAWVVATMRGRPSSRGAPPPASILPRLLGAWQVSLLAAHGRRVPRRATRCRAPPPRAARRRACGGMGRDRSATCRPTRASPRSITPPAKGISSFRLGVGIIGFAALGHEAQGEGLALGGFERIEAHHAIAHEAGREGRLGRDRAAFEGVEVELPHRGLRRAGMRRGAAPRRRIPRWSRRFRPADPGLADRLARCGRESSGSSCHGLLRR
jgi:hypothetical protein